jgi:hypothetical protein
LPAQEWALRSPDEIRGGVGGGTAAPGLRFADASASIEISLDITQIFP